ncbi:MAG: nucleotidyltransferase domain-containing protein [Candidatus Nanohaloarchaea archaeon]
MSGETVRSGLAQLLIPEWKVAVLKRLVDRPDYSYTIRELASETPGSYGSVRTFVHGLADVGVVDRQKKGNSVLVSYSRDNRYSDTITSILRGETERLREAAERYASEVYREGIEAVILYGSVAKGTAGEDSDIDILVLAEDVEAVEREANQAAQSIESELDVHVSPLVESLGEFWENLSAGERFEQEVVEWGETLEGKELEELSEDDL